MRHFLSDLYSKSEAELANYGLNKPCEYAVIGLGSMSLGQITPYSDLEFAILIDHEGQTKEEGDRIKQYFRNLTHLVNFKVINLGETTIPISRFGIDMDHLVHKGVSLDLGGKTPLGRIDGDKQTYELIQISDKMIEYASNRYKTDEKYLNLARDEKLPSVLESFCYVYGNQKIVFEYQSRLESFLVSMNGMAEREHEARVMQILKNGFIEEFAKSMLSSNVKKSPQSIGDLQKLEPLSETSAKLFDVKKEIYRLPDRLIYNLGLFYGIKCENPWSVVYGLEDKKIISQDAVKHLEYAISFAVMLRLKSYHISKGQVEDMSLFSEGFSSVQEKESLEKIWHLSDEDMEESGGLFKYFYTALSLHNKMAEFSEEYYNLNNEDKAKFFGGIEFYDDNKINKGLIYYRLLRYQEVLENLEEVIENSQNHQLSFRLNWQLRSVLGVIYYNFGQGEDSIAQFQHILNLALKFYEEETHQEVASCLNDLGMSNERIGNYTKAEEYYERSLELRNRIYQDELHIDIAYSLNNIALINDKLGNYKKAVEFHTKSLDIRIKIHKGTQHPDIAHSYNNLGEVHRSIGNYKLAINYFIESIKILNTCYKGEMLPDIADCLNNLGLTYIKLGSYDEAIMLLTKSMDIKNTFYQFGQCPEVLSSLNNLGIAYRLKGNIPKALECYEKSYEMQKKIYKDGVHSDIAATLNNIGLVYYINGDFESSIRFNTQSLEMQKAIYNGKANLDIALSLNNIGSIYYQIGEYEKAIENYQESLSILNIIYDGIHNSDIADCLSNLGAAYYNLDNYEKSIEYHTKCYLMRSEIYKEESNMHLCSSLNNLGIVYCQISAYEQAIEYYTKALTMLRVVCSNESNQEVVNCINNLIEIHAIMGNYEDVLSYKNQKQILISSLTSQEDIADDILNNETPLFINAIITANLDLIKKLLIIGVDVNKTDTNLASPLYYSLGFAEQPLNFEIIEYLLINKANPNQPMEDGDTPMHMAHYNGSKKAIELLIQYKGRLNEQNQDGKTPLHALLESDSVSLDEKLEVVQAFLGKYDTTITDKEGKTAIDYAEEHCLEVLSYLLSEEAGSELYKEVSVETEESSNVVLSDNATDNINQDEEKTDIIGSALDDAIP